MQAFQIQSLWVCPKRPHALASLAGSKSVHAHHGSAQSIEKKARMRCSKVLAASLVPPFVISRVSWSRCASRYRHGLSDLFRKRGMLAQEFAHCDLADHEHTAISLELLPAKFGW